jgi:hypothetical protein
MSEAAVDTAWAAARPCSAGGWQPLKPRPAAMG